MLALSGAVWLAATGDSEEPSVTATPTPTPTPGPATFRTKQIYGVGRQPRGIAIADGRTFVVSLKTERLSSVDARRPQRPRPSVVVGEESTDLAADGDRLWVTNPSIPRVIELDAAKGSVEGGIDVARPVDVAVGAAGVWVLDRGMGTEEDDLPPGSYDRILRYARDGTQMQDPIEMPLGVRAFTTGGGFLWVALTDRPAILKLSRTGETLRTVESGDANNLAFGAGRLWASVPEADTVLEIPPDAPYIPYPVGADPAGLAVMGRHVYVANKNASEVQVLRIGRRRQRRSPSRCRRAHE